MEQEIMTEIVSTVKPSRQVRIIRIKQIRRAIGHGIHVQKKNDAFRASKAHGAAKLYYMQ